MFHHHTHSKFDPVPNVLIPNYNISDIYRLGPYVHTC
jgi:hypothetical protein